MRGCELPLYEFIAHLDFGEATWKRQVDDNGYILPISHVHAVSTEDTFNIFTFIIKYLEYTKL
jgi:hypothetical protein